MLVFFFSSRRRHTRCYRDWSSDVCSSDLIDDLSPLAQRVGPGVDERFVLQVLELVPGNRVDYQERADDRPAALGDDVVGVRQELAGGIDVVVMDAVRP